MSLESPSYPGQLALCLSPLESRALRGAIRLVLGLYIAGNAVFSHRSKRDALRRIHRKLKRLSTPS